MEKGANIQAETGSKMNALHGAVEGGRIDTVKVLMEFVQGKDELKLALTMAKNGDDKTAWDISAAAKNRAICQVLKEHGDTNGASSSCTICWYKWDGRNLEQIESFLIIRWFMISRWEVEKLIDINSVSE